MAPVEVPPVPEPVTATMEKAAPSLGQQDVSASPEFAMLKTKLKATWSSGNYAVFAEYMRPAAIAYLSRHSFPAGTKVLDVACGAGQTAIPLAKMSCDVTGVDIAPNLVARARERAREEGATAEFVEGDAEELPFGDGEFDVVFSMFGAMFAPRGDKVAMELARVCKPGGRIIMCNWTPQGFIGQMFKIVGKHAPPSPMMQSPVLWGDEATVGRRFAGMEVKTERLPYPFEYPFPAADVVAFFARYYGPTVKAFEALGEKGGELKAELVEHWARHNVAGEEGKVRVDAEFLEVVAVKP
ncbi:putative methyltransferase [Hyaloraphidium curvatum]|nr:putative methyltransferase [Hyaloraphidium curvatum]